MSDIEPAKQFISVNRTARIFSIGDVSSASLVWICLHGYGQNVKRFTQALQSLKSEQNAVLIPEALHRFYIKGNSGDVGASWMTKEEREFDIQDNISYLDTLCRELNIEHKQIAVLGFSQGAATAMRWVCCGNIAVKQLVMWAGAIPPDMDINRDLNRLKKTDIDFVFGDQDEYYNESVISGITDELSKINVPFRMLRFEGGHRLNSALLRELSTY